MERARHATGSAPLGGRGCTSSHAHADKSAGWPGGVVVVAPFTENCTVNPSSAEKSHMSGEPVLLHREAVLQESGDKFTNGKWRLPRYWKRHLCRVPLRLKRRYRNTSNAQANEPRHLTQPQSFCATTIQSFEKRLVPFVAVQAVGMSQLD